MSEMMERVAEGIWRSQTGRAPGAKWDEMSDGAKTGWRLYARAAIQAMRDPTEEMIEAAAPKDDDGREPFVRDFLREAWRTMIDEALK